MAFRKSTQCLNNKKIPTTMTSRTASLSNVPIDQMISRYMPLIASEQKLMMRPCQMRKPSWAATTKLQAANFKTSPL